jgi:hypothetical protein
MALCDAGTLIFQKSISEVPRKSESVGLEKDVEDQLERQCED